MDTYLNIFSSGTYSDLLQLADGNLRTEDGFSFDIHKVILACKSEYFRSMFCGFNKDRREFNVPGISGRCLALILNFIYTEENYVNVENMAEVLIAADYLQITNLHKKIKKIFKDYLTTANCIQVLQVADLISDAEIAHESLRFVKITFEEIVRTSKLAKLELSFELLKNILSSSSLRGCKESIVWEIIVEWTEKDISTRLCYVPKLLMCLASKELEENLSLSIFQHAIVLQNPFMIDLQEIIPSTDSRSCMDIILRFLQNYPDAFRNSNEFIIPSHLHVIFSSDNEDEINNLCITFDENIDLWQKMGESDFEPDFLEVVGHHVYLFDLYPRRCAKFDLFSREWVPMQKSRKLFGDVYGVTRIDEYLCILGKVSNFNSWKFIIHVYDTLNDKWSFEKTSLLETDAGIEGLATVTLDKKIYVVGKRPDEVDDMMMMQVYDPATQETSQLSPPSEYRSAFAIVTYCQKIYLIGGKGRHYYGARKVEAYTPETDTWKYLPDLPYTYSQINAIVINGRIIVYGYDDEAEYMNNVCWNDAAGKWEKLDPPRDFRNFNKRHFATVEDVDTIRMIKESRIRDIDYEKSPFNSFDCIQ